MAEDLLFLSRADVEQAVSVAEAIPLVRAAFIQLSSGAACVPLRTKIEVAANAGTVLYMPVHLPASEILAVKVVSLFAHNPALGLPLIHALVLVNDARTGRALAVMDGERLTAVRTGAAAGLATDLLARRDATVAAVFGAGIQGRTQLEAIHAVRPLRRAWVLDPDPARSAVFCADMSARLAIDVRPAPSPAVLREAHVVSTVTTSPTPVFAPGDLAPGVHLNAVGAYKPTEREIPGETVRAAKVVVDQRAACLAEAGDLVIPLAEGLFGPDHLYAELGEIAAGQRPGRANDTETTLFKSVGNAVQDAAVAARVLARAQELGLGTRLGL